MAHTRDGRYIVKELTEGDHQSLLVLAESYLCHLRGGPSLLCLFYLHFQELGSGRRYVAMRNVLPQQHLVFIYDLKGCADDKTITADGQKVPVVHKRIWKVGMWVRKSSWSKDRCQYYQGKLDARHVQIQTTKSQRSF